MPIFQARVLSRQQVTQPVRLRLSSPDRVTTQIGIWTFRKISPFRSKVVKNGVYALNQVCKRRLSATHHTSKILAILKFKIRCTRHTRVSASVSNTALIGSNTQRFCSRQVTSCTIQPASGTRLRRLKTQSASTSVWDMWGKQKLSRMHSVWY